MHDRRNNQALGDKRTYGRRLAGTRVPVVEAIATRRHPGWRNSELYAAARRCLPLLRERAAQFEQIGSLLRPASADAGDLLRPAARTDERDEQLVRPSEGRAE